MQQDSVILAEHKILVRTFLTIDYFLMTDSQPTTESPETTTTSTSAFDTVDEMAGVTGPNLLATGIELLLLIGIPRWSFLIGRWCYRNNGKYKYRVIALIAFSMLFWLLLPVPFFLFSVEKSVPKSNPNLGGRVYFRTVIDRGPPIAKKTSEWLTSPAFTPPPKWFLILTILVVGALFLYWLSRRSISKIAAPGPAAPGPAAPGPAATRVPSVTWHTVHWEKNRNTWEPICPRCGVKMALQDEHQRTGMTVFGAGGNAKVVCPKCKHTVLLNVSRRSVQKRVQAEFDKK